MEPGAFRLRRDVGWDRREGIHKGTWESGFARREDGQAAVEAHLPELETIRWTRRAKWKVKVVAFAKDGIREHADSVRQHKPNAKPVKLPVLDVSPRRPAATNADVREHRAAPHNQSVVVPINIPQLRSA